MECENVFENATFINSDKKRNQNSMFSFSCDVLCEDEEIISFSTEDRKFATVKKGDKIKVTVFKYPFWSFEKAGTLYGGRLIKKFK